MQTVMITHEVDEVDHWLRSPERAAFFEPRGMTVRTFTDPGGSNRVGLILEVPDMATLEASLKTDEAAAAMRHDGVRPDTIQMLVAADG